MAYQLLAAFAMASEPECSDTHCPHEEEQIMRAIIGAVIAATTLAGCGGWSHDPRVDSATAPKSTTAKAPKSTATAAKPGTVAVNYKGPDGYNIAVIKADEWCDKHFGASNAHLVKDDKATGRATFTCVPL
jgi:hypothetical protein